MTQRHDDASQSDASLDLLVTNIEGFELKSAVRFWIEMPDGSQLGISNDASRRSRATSWCDDDPILVASRVVLSTATAATIATTYRSHSCPYERNSRI